MLEEPTAIPLILGVEGVDCLLRDSFDVTLERAFVEVAQQLVLPVSDCLLVKEMLFMARLGDICAVFLLNFVVG